MFHSLERTLSQAVSEHLKRSRGLDLPIAIEQPKQSSFGELALPLAFQLARQLKLAPKVIATELCAELEGKIPGVASLEIAGNGYLNVRFDRAWYVRQILNGNDQATQEFSTRKTIIEHTNINPNKAAHIGHVRNAILGDTFSRMLRADGNRVEVQNYIDNTGVQVADVVAAFHFMEQKTPAEVQALTKAPRFDYLCWDIYAKISQLYDSNAEAKAWRAETLHSIEAAEGPLAAMGHVVADAIVGCHIRTMLRLDIRYDVLPRESEILHLKFWANCFDQLKAKGAIYLESEGKNKGCWVMPGSAFKENAGEEDSKVIVRSNGIVTYVGKDIAYQLWKFGLLGKDFYYSKLLTYEDGHPLYVSQASPEASENISFGSGYSVYNVIDSRQSYLQDVVVAGLRALGYPEQAGRSTHFSYEMVALSPSTCIELGIELSEEDKARPYVEVSGRKGLGVKADDLLDKLIAKAKEEVDSRNGEAPEAERLLVATQIATGALRYFMLKFTRSSVIAFDLQEALSFTGETGPYVQYAAVRSNRILARLAERDILLPDFRLTLTEEILKGVLATEDLWQLVIAASRLESALQSALDSGEPAHLARFAFQLAQAFSSFYQEYKVLDEADPKRQQVLLWLTQYFSHQLTRTLRILGISVPAYM